MISYAVKKTVYHKLVAIVSSIDTTGFVLKTKYDAGKSDLEKELPGTSRLVKIIFGAIMSSFTKIHNKKRYFDSWLRSYKRITTYTVCRKSAFN